MIVACVLKSGGEYEVKHVMALRDQILSHSPDADIVCLSDVDFTLHFVRRVPLTHGWPGWWSKLELFRPGALPVGERVLYLDLDTTIVGPIDDLLARPEPFLALADFYRRPPLVPERR